MASRTVTRKFVDGTKKTFLRPKQGRRKERDYVIIRLRVPVEYHALMTWENEKCGGNLSVTSQIQDAIRARLCGCVYTQLLKT